MLQHLIWQMTALLEASMINLTSFSIYNMSDGPYHYMIWARASLCKGVKVQCMKGLTHLIR
jgi:hypothetical protein